MPHESLDNTALSDLAIAYPQPSEQEQQEQEPIASGNWFSDFWSGAKAGLGKSLEHPTKLLPFVSQVPEYKEAAQYKEAVNRVLEGEATDSDIDLIRSKQREAAEVESEPSAKKIGRLVGTIVPSLPGYAAEFILTRGIASSARKKAAPIIGRLLGTKGDDAAKAIIAREIAARKGIEVPISAAEKTAEGMITRFGSGAVGAAARAVPIAGARIPAEVVSLTTPLPKEITEDGAIKFIIEREGDGFAEAIKKSAIGGYIDVLSESLGGPLLEMPGVSAVRRALKTVVVDRFLKQKPNLALTKLLNMTADAAGWNGVIGEVGEEIAADLMKAGVGVQEGIQHTPELLAAEIISFAIPGAAGKTAGLLFRDRKTLEAPPAISEAPLPKLRSRIGTTDEERQRIVKRLNELLSERAGAIDKAAAESADFIEREADYAIQERAPVHVPQVKAPGSVETVGGQIWSPAKSETRVGPAEQTKEKTPIVGGEASEPELILPASGEYVTKFIPTIQQEPAETPVQQTTQKRGDELQSVSKAPVKTLRAKAKQPPQPPLGLSAETAGTIVTHTATPTATPPLVATTEAQQANAPAAQPLATRTLPEPPAVVQPPPVSVQTVASQLPKESTEEEPVAPEVNEPALSKSEKIVVRDQLLEPPQQIVDEEQQSETAKPSVQVQKNKEEEAPHQSAFAVSAKKVIETLEGYKTPPEQISKELEEAFGKVMALPVPVIPTASVHIIKNAIIDAVIYALKVGMSIEDAMRRGIKRLAELLNREPTEDEKTYFRQVFAHLEGLFRGVAVDAAKNAIEMGSGRAEAVAISISAVAERLGRQLDSDEVRYIKNRVWSVLAPDQPFRAKVVSKGREYIKSASIPTIEGFAKAMGVDAKTESEQDAIKEAFRIETRAWLSSLSPNELVGIMDRIGVINDAVIRDVTYGLKTGMRMEDAIRRGLQKLKDSLERDPTEDEKAYFKQTFLSLEGLYRNAMRNVAIKQKESDATKPGIISEVIKEAAQQLRRPLSGDEYSYVMNRITGELYPEKNIPRNVSDTAKKYISDTRKKKKTFDEFRSLLPSDVPDDVAKEAWEREIYSTSVVRRRELYKNIEQKGRSYFRAGAIPTINGFIKAIGVEPKTQEERAAIYQAFTLEAYAWLSSLNSGELSDILNKLDLRHKFRSAIREVTEGKQKGGVRVVIPGEITDDERDLISKLLRNAPVSNKAAEIVREIWVHPPSGEPDEIDKKIAAIDKRIKSARESGNTELEAQLSLIRKRLQGVSVLPQFEELREVYDQIKTVEEQIKRAQQAGEESLETELALIRNNLARERDELRGEIRTIVIEEQRRALNLADMARLRDRAISEAWNKIISGEGIARNVEFKVDDIDLSRNLTGGVRGMILTHDNVIDVTTDMLSSQGAINPTLFRRKIRAARDIEKILASRKPDMARVARLRKAISGYDIKLEADYQHVSDLRMQYIEAKMSNDRIGMSRILAALNDLLSNRGAGDFMPPYYRFSREELSSPAIAEMVVSGSGGGNLTKRAVSVLDRKTGAVYLLAVKNPHGVENGIIIQDPLKTGYRHFTNIATFLSEMIGRKNKQRPRWRIIDSFLYNRRVHSFSNVWSSIRDYEKSFATPVYIAYSDAAQEARGKPAAFSIKTEDEFEDESLPSQKDAGEISDDAVARARQSLGIFGTPVLGGVYDVSAGKVLKDMRVAEIEDAESDPPGVPFFNPFEDVLSDVSDFIRSVVKRIHLTGEHVRTLYNAIGARGDIQAAITAKPTTPGAEMEQRLIREAIIKMSSAEKLLAHKNGDRISYTEALEKTIEFLEGANEQADKEETKEARERAFEQIILQRYSPKIFGELTESITESSLAESIRRVSAAIARERAAVRQYSAAEATAVAPSKLGYVRSGPDDEVTAGIRDEINRLTFELNRIVADYKLAMLKAEKNRTLLDRLNAAKKTKANENKIRTLKQELDEINNEWNESEFQATHNAITQKINELKRALRVYPIEKQIEALNERLKSLTAEGVEELKKIASGSVKEKYAKVEEARAKLMNIDALRKQINKLASMLEEGGNKESEKNEGWVYMGAYIALAGKPKRTKEEEEILKRAREAALGSKRQAQQPIPAASQPTAEQQQSILSDEERRAATERRIREIEEQARAIHAEPPAPYPAPAYGPIKPVKSMTNLERLKLSEKEYAERLAARGYSAEDVEKLRRRHARPTSEETHRSVNDVKWQLLQFLGLESLPEHVRVIYDANAEFGGLYEDGEITINAARVVDPVMALIEEGLHGVWENPELQSAWKEWKDAATEEDIAREIALRPSQSMSPDEVREEAAIRRLIENRPSDKSLIRRLIDAILNALRAIGINIADSQQNRDRILDAAMRYIVHRGPTSRAATRMASPTAKEEQDRRAEIKEWDKKNIKENIRYELGKLAVANLEETKAIVDGFKRESELISEAEENDRKYAEAREKLLRARSNALERALLNDIPPAEIPTINDEAFVDTLHRNEKIRPNNWSSAYRDELRAAQGMHIANTRAVAAFKLNEAAVHAAEIAKAFDPGNPKHANVINAITSEISEAASKRDALLENADVKKRYKEILENNEKIFSRRAHRRAMRLPAVREAFINPSEELDALIQAYGRIVNDISGIENPINRSLVINEIKRFLARFQSLLESINEQYGEIESTLKGKIDALQKEISKDIKEKAEAKILQEDAEAIITKAAVDLGGVLDQREVDLLRSISASVAVFAKRFGEKLRSIGRHKDAELFLSYLKSLSVGDKMAMPPTLHPSMIMIGISQENFSFMLRAMQASSKYASAVYKLIQAAASTEKELPDSLISRLIQKATAGDMEAAQKLYSHIEHRATRIYTKSDSAHQEHFEEMMRLLVEIHAWRLARKLFNDVASSKGMAKLINEVNKNERPFFEMTWLAPSKGNATGRRIFGKFTTFNTNGEKVEIEQVEINPDDTPLSFGTINPKIVKAIEWMMAAEDHVALYDAARDAHERGLSAAPEQLGFDLAVVEGLRDAVKYVGPIIESMSVVFSAAPLATSKATALMMRLDYFRQWMKVAENTPGVFGVELRNALSVVLRMANEMRRVSNQERFAGLIKLRTKAMKAHSVETLMNQTLYRQTVFNAAGHWGRMPISPVKVGFVDPLTGVKFTKEDVDLVRRVSEWTTAIHEVVESRRQYGIIRGEKEGRFYRSKSIPPGEIPLNRIAGRRAIIFANEIVAVYEDAAKRGIQSISPTEDLSSSKNPIVRFWDDKNQTDLALISHILDSERMDRAVRSDDNMLRAMRALARDVHLRGHTLQEWSAKDSAVPNNRIKLETFDDVVNELALRYTGPGDARTAVIEALDSELRQYAVNARSMISTRAEEEGLGVVMMTGVSARTEFTQEANELLLPGVYYDYGTFHNYEFDATIVRALREPLKNLITAAELAAREIRSKINQINEASHILKDPIAIRELTGRLFADFGGSVKTAEHIERALMELVRESTAKAPDRGPIKRAIVAVQQFFGGIWMASPPVGIMNISGSGFAAFVDLMRVSGASRTLSLLRAASYMTGAFLKLPLAIGMSVMNSIYKTTGMPSLVRWLKRSSPGLYNAAIKFANHIAIVTAYDSLLSARREGYSEEVKPFFMSLMDILDKVDQTVEEETAIVRRTREVRFGSPLKLGRKIFKWGIVAPFASAHLAYQKAGIRYSDDWINAQLRNMPRLLEAELQGVAIDWGKARETLGEYNPTDKRWVLKPEEFSSRVMENSQAVNLGHMRLLFEVAGMPNLERLLWDYYKRWKTDKDAEFLNQEQRDNLVRSWVEQANKPTFANRSVSARTNTWLWLFSYLGQYIANLALKLSDSYRSAPNAAAAQRMSIAVSTTIWFAISATLLMMVGTSLRELWRRYIMGNKRAKELTPVDSEFWKGGGLGLPANLAMVGLSAIPYMGPFLLNLMGSRMGRRGWEPSQSIPILSVLTDAIGLGHALATQPMRHWSEFFRRYAQRNLPGFNEVSNLLGKTSSIDFYNASSAVARAARAANLQAGRRSPSFGSQWEIGPGSGIRASLIRAMMEGNAAEVARLKAELFEYHKKRLMRPGKTSEEVLKDAQEAVGRDFEMMNPAYVGFDRRKPTEAEWNILWSKMSPSEREDFQRAFSAYRAIAPLFGKDPDGIRPHQVPSISDLGPATERPRRAVLGASSGITLSAGGAPMATNIGAVGPYVPSAFYTMPREDRIGSWQEKAVSVGSKPEFRQLYKEIGSREIRIPSGRTIGARLRSGMRTSAMGTKRSIGLRRRGWPRLTRARRRRLGMKIMIPSYAG